MTVADCGRSHCYLNLRKMTLIIVLMLLAALLLVIELVLLPGISVAGIGALLAFGGAVWRTFYVYGSDAGFISIGIAVSVAVVVTILSLRAKTWQRLSLKSNITSSAQEFPAELNVKIGDRGVAITRLAPMGKVEIDGHTFEAKSIDAYVDPKSAVEVTGFENFNVIVRRTK